MDLKKKHFKDSQIFKHGAFEEHFLRILKRICQVSVLNDIFSKESEPKYLNLSPTDMGQRF